MGSHGVSIRRTTAHAGVSAMRRARARLRRRLAFWLKAVTATGHRRCRADVDLVLEGRGVQAQRAVGRRVRGRPRARRRRAEVRAGARRRRALRLAPRRAVLRRRRPAPPGRLCRVPAGDGAARGAGPRAVRLVAGRPARVHDPRERGNGRGRCPRRPRARGVAPRADARRGRDRILARDARDQPALPAGRARPAHDDGRPLARAAARARARLVAAARSRRRHRARDEVHDRRRPRPAPRDVPRLAPRRPALVGLPAGRGHRGRAARPEPRLGGGPRLGERALVPRTLRRARATRRGRSSSST